MLQEERHNRILSELAVKGAVRVSDLAQSFQISESTIRRDINELAATDRLRKVFGGAVALERNIKTVTEDMAAKASLNVREKESVARYAASLICEDDFVYLDAGTTTERMIDLLKCTSAIFVTNGITHGQKLAQRGCRVYMTGGLINAATLAITGTETVAFLQKCNFTKCFMGVNGIDPERGFTTPDFDEAMVKQEAMKRSAVSYILADGSKFGCVSAATFGSLADACVITDRVENQVFKKYTIVREVGTD